MSAMQQLLKTLQVKKTASNQFLAVSGPEVFRIYGGLTVTQALDAARQCCPPEYAVQSLHGQFLRPGDSQHDIDIHVEYLKDGRRFKLYNVYCKQQGKTIFFATVTFHLPELGNEHALTPPPLILPSEDKGSFFTHRMNMIARDQLQENSVAIETRTEDAVDFEKEQLPEQIIWFKATDEINLSDWQHTLLLSYVSDWNLPSVAIRPHIIPKDNNHVLASLDHTIWFYRQPDMSHWVAYVQDSPAALNARGHTRGLFYDQQNNLLASVCQESFFLSTPKEKIEATK
jgi:acyl-CoA thioesterase-2